MKTRLLAPLIGIALTGLLPAGCDRPAATRAPGAVVQVRAAPLPTVSSPAPEAGPHPGDDAWASWFKAVAEVGRPCDEVMTALSQAPRARRADAVRQLARSGESDCFAASGGYQAVPSPTPLPPAARRELDRGISALSKGYLGRSLGLNNLARPSPDAVVDPEAVQILGHAQDDIVAARARLVALARRYGYSRVDGAEGVDAAPTAALAARAGSAAPRAAKAHPARWRVATWRARPHDHASGHRAWTGEWRARERRWRPPPYPRYVASAASCDLSAPLSDHNCVHAYRNSEDAYAAQDRAEDARPRHGCRRFWVLPCKLFGRDR